MQKFNIERDDWGDYFERLENYFIANDIMSDTQKRDILLSMIGDETYKLFESRFSPVKPHKKTVEELVELVAQCSELVEPDSNVVTARCKFLSCTKRPGQRVAEYISELCRLLDGCQYNKDEIDDMLRDQIVFGIQDSRTRDELCKRPALMCKEAVEIALSVEKDKGNKTEPENQQNLQISFLVSNKTN